MWKETSNLAGTKDPVSLLGHMKDWFALPFTEMFLQMCEKRGLTLWQAAGEHIIQSQEQASIHNSKSGQGKALNELRSELRALEQHLRTRIKREGEE